MSCVIARDAREDELAFNFDLGSQAAGTETHLNAASVSPDPLPVEVRLERAVGTRRLSLPATGVLMTNISPKGDALAAQFTLSGHTAYYTSHQLAPPHRSGVEFEPNGTRAGVREQPAYAP